MNQLSNPELIREWDVISYNKNTKDYLLKCDDEINKTRIITCLRCSTRLKPNKTYKGYKDVKNRKLIITK